MEQNENLSCGKCSSPLPTAGYFCGACLTQFKCKTCESLLDTTHVGCVNCGTPRVERNQVSSSGNANTFRLHETLTDRIIEATFSDTVGKDLSGILRDAYVSNRIKQNGKNLLPNANNGEEGTGSKTDVEFQEVEVLSEPFDKQPKQHSEGQSSKSTSPQQYPTMKAIAMKNLPATETEWIVVYAFYGSEYGEKTFTREDIINQYIESNRFDKATTKRDLYTNLKRAVNAGYINPLTTDYSILDIGIAKAKEIISRTSGSAPRVKASSKSKKDNSNEEGNDTKSKKNSSGVKNLKRLTNIDFEPSGKESLEAFYSKYLTKNDNERNLLFVYYLQETLGINEISYDHIYTCYDTLELKVSENLPQTVRNTASRTGWIEIKKSNISTTIKGNNQIKAWNKRFNK